MKFSAVLVIVASLVGGLGLSGCAADEYVYNGAGSSNGATEKSNKITGSVSEWTVDVSAQEADKGDVIFAITNFGSIPHEFLVVKTDFKLGKIPLGENNRFDEEAEGLTVIDEISEWEPGTTGTLKVNLKPGNYQLLCNIQGHYKAGMYTPLIVR